MSESTSRPSYGRSSSDSVSGPGRGNYTPRTGEFRQRTPTNITGTGEGLIAQDSSNPFESILSGAAALVNPIAGLAFGGVFAANKFLSGSGSDFYLNARKSRLESLIEHYPDSPSVDEWKKEKEVIESVQSGKSPTASGSPVSSGSSSPVYSGSSSPVSFGSKLGTYVLVALVGFGLYLLIKK